MAEIAGATAGILATDESAQRGMLAAAQTAGEIGKLSLLPSEIALRQAQAGQATAHADLYRQDAGDKRQAALEKLQMLQLQQDHVQEQALIDAGHAQGREPTAADRPVSQADPLRRFADYAEKKRGVSPLLLAGVRKQIADITEKEAIGADHAQRAVTQATKDRGERAEQIGNLASAAAESPLAWMDVISDPAKAAMFPPELLSMPWEAARPHLKVLADVGLGTKIRAELAREDAEAKSRAARRTTGVAQANATIELAKVRTRVAKKLLDDIIANEGEHSAAALQAKKDLSANRQVRTEALNNKLAPPAPLDVKAREIGKVYSSPDGKTRMIWQGKDAGWRPYGMTPVQRKAATALVNESDNLDAELKAEQ